MDRRAFIRLGAGSVAVTMLPLGGCSTSAPLPDIENSAGPTIVTSDGTRFETRPNAHAVLVSDQRVGKQGALPGQFNYPVAIATLGGLAYVVDTGNHRIQVLDKTGATVASFGETELLYPGGITVTSDRELVVADSRNGRLVVFNEAGDVTRTLGEGTLSAPRGLAARGGNVIVADPGLREVVEIDRRGAIVRRFGADWVLPYGVAATDDFIFVADAAAIDLVVLDRSGRPHDTIALERAPTFVSLGADGIVYVS